jgi:hypothetical protein
MSQESKNPVKREYGGTERNAYNAAIRAELPWIAPFLDARSVIVGLSRRFGGHWSEVNEMVNRFIDAAKVAVEERCEGKREHAFDLSKLRRYKDFDDTFVNFLGGREILIIEKIAYGAPDTDSWDTVRDAVDESKRAAKNALKNPPPNRGPKAASHVPPADKKEEKAGAEAVIIAMMRDDPEFAREVEALAFRRLQKKMGISQK